MKNLSTSKIAAILISALMIFAMGQAVTMVRGTVTIQTYAFCNVAPSPDGVGQPVTVDFWLAVPVPGSVDAIGLKVTVTLPDGTSQTLGTFTSDLTGGTYTTYTPTTLGNYSFQMTYGGQTLSGRFAGYAESASTSNVATLIVQQQPVGGYPNTPLPTSWWQTPVSAENVQNWYSITGPWLGLTSNAFGATGAYNDTGDYNPYTMGPTTGHILWTKPWAVGGVAGGDNGGTEQTGSYWGTAQYEPKWEPIVIDGILYATQYTTTTGYNNGIVATNLYNGQTMWVLNTTNALLWGYAPDYHSINQYGVVGPYILTSGTLPPADTGGSKPANSGTQYNLYDGLTGKYVASIVNGSSNLFTTVDANGNIVGYLKNSTYGIAKSNVVTLHPEPGITVHQNITGPSLEAWNLTMALGEGAGSGQWSISLNHVYLWNDGLMWSNPSIPLTINGNAISLSAGGLGVGQIGSNVIVLTAGYGATSVGDTAGWAIEAGFSQTNGALLWGPYNRTYTPYTRISENFVELAGDGVYVDCNENTFVTTGYSLFTGSQLWQITLTGPNGTPPNSYDDYGIQNVLDSTTGIMYLWGLGGDIWALNMATGAIVWQTSTTLLQGSPGSETPYAVWPIWVQYGGNMAGGNNILYLSEGHEYDPPLFHGAQMLAINGTNGQLIWKELAFEDTAAENSYNIMTSLNAYDNQVYAYGQGPSRTTISVPSPITTVGSKVMIEGRVTDVSAGASQQLVASNFPNGLPCVSDASMSGLMEAAYEQQAMPHNSTGVPVTLSVLDSNNNYRVIGTTTSNALGDYGFTWTPDISGNYTVYATFAGTGAYYSSSASTFFYAGTPAATIAPTSTPTTGLASNATLEYGIVAIIIVIIIIGAVLALLVTRKHP